MLSTSTRESEKKALSPTITTRYLTSSNTMNGLTETEIADLSAFELPRPVTMQVKVSGEAMLYVKPFDSRTVGSSSQSLATAMKCHTKAPPKNRARPTTNLRKFHVVRLHFLPFFKSSGSACLSAVAISSADEKRREISGCVLRAIKLEMASVS